MGPKQYWLPDFDVLENMRLLCSLPFSPSFGYLLKGTEGHWTAFYMCESQDSNCLPCDICVVPALLTPRVRNEKGVEGID